MKYEFVSYGPGIGCKSEGFGTECKNCCALTKARTLAGKKGQTFNLIANTVCKKDDEWFWSGKIEYLPNYRDKLLKCGKKGKVKRYLISYMSDPALWDNERIYDTILDIYEFRRQKFYWLTKAPILLSEKIEFARQCMLRRGIDITKFKNMRFCVSVGLKDSKFRVKQLQEYFKNYKKEIFAKPLLEDIGDIDLKNIESIRISAEKGKKKREFNKDWAYRLIKQAKAQNVKVIKDRI